MSTRCFNANAPNLPGLKQFGRIDSERRTQSGKTSIFTCYVALSKTLTPGKMLEAMRMQWDVENGLH
jgi:hypothetical protein